MLLERIIQPRHANERILQKRRRRPELNLVPLIDVLVMLIFFAFVTMQFRSATMLNLKLPKIETAGKNEFKGSITISIDENGDDLLQRQGRDRRRAARAR